MDRILKIKEVTDVTGACRASIYSWAADGRFPAPVKIGPKASGWRMSEVQAWIANLQPERRAAA
ncbi:AlpA family phage regulatory protein [Caballeronia sp. LjRoot34]|uniref:helix-turn-helix transcriptional regulator n=1 Tax=Caballeronia sp. LjRoot34 TaxID=3342325 RepID=UPI003ECED130